MNTEFKIRTFGRIKSRGFSDAKIDKLNNILPKYAIKIDNNELKNFPVNCDKLYFEIGFGYGEHTLHQALLNKDTQIIGCETYINGVLSLLDKIENNNVNNIKIFNGDARLLLEKMQDHSIDKVFILFPDPWPKKRHADRRFVNPENLKELARIIKKGGILRIATDHKVYKAWTLRTMHCCNDFKWTAKKSSDWRNEPSDWVKTKYQQKAIREGRKPVFFEYERV